MRLTVDLGSLVWAVILTQIELEHFTLFFWWGHALAVVVGYCVSAHIKIISSVQGVTQRRINLLVTSKGI